MSIPSCFHSGLSLYLFSCFLLCLLLCCHGDAAAQPASGAPALGGRVGATIDQYERRYFSLFTGVGDFSSARIERNGAEVRFVIARENGMSDTAVSIPGPAFDDLRTVIDHYEAFFIGVVPPVEWEAIDGIISPNSPLGFDTVSLAVTTRTGIVRGMLLHAAAEYLAIVPDSLDQAWPRLQRHMVVIPPEDIMRVELAPSSRSFFLEIDIPVSGNDTVYRRDVAGLMGSRAFFPLLPFPELRALAARTLSERRDTPGTAPSVDEIDERMEMLPFTIAAGMGLRVASQPTEVGVISYNSHVRPTITVLPPSPYFGVRAGYDLFGLIRLEGAYITYPEPFKEGDYQAVHKSRQYELGGRILLKRGRRTFQAAGDRIDISVGASKLWRSVEIESMIGTKFPGRYPNINPGIVMFRQSGSVDGVAFMAGFGYKLRSFLSLELEGRYSLYEDFRVRQREAWSLDGTRYVVHAYQRNMLSLNSGDLLLWLRFHL